MEEKVENSSINKRMKNDTSTFSCQFQDLTWLAMAEERRTIINAQKKTTQLLRIIDLMEKDLDSYELRITLPPNPIQCHGRLRNRQPFRKKHYLLYYMISNPKILSFFLFSIPEY